jgi:hypothetical protein
MASGEDGRIGLTTGSETQSKKLYKNWFRPIQEYLSPMDILSGLESLPHYKDPFFAAHWQDLAGA